MGDVIFVSYKLTQCVRDYKKIMNHLNCYSCTGMKLLVKPQSTMTVTSGRN